MLRDVDEALRGLFRAGLTTLGAGTPGGVAAAQIGFAPPDTDWVSDVTTLGRPALNVYLADLRENRALRSNERFTAPPASVRPAPMRLDCHYLISAWSPSKDRPTKTLEEHDVLSEATGVLAGVRVLAAGGEDLPIAVAPAEGFGKLAEFWGTMGQRHRWKPVICLVVTVAVELSAEVSGAAVTTLFAEFAGAGETRIQIGGLVLDAAGTPVARAWVQLQDPAGTPVQATRTDGGGRFTFTGLAAGDYRLRVRSAQHPEPAPVPITVPAPAGAYDVALP